MFNKVYDELLLVHGITLPSQHNPISDILCTGDSARMPSMAVPSLSLQHSRGGWMCINNRSKIMSKCSRCSREGTREGSLLCLGTQVGKRGMSERAHKAGDLEISYGILMKLRGMLEGN